MIRDSKYALWYFRSSLTAAVKYHNAYFKSLIKNYIIIAAEAPNRPKTPQRNGFAHKAATALADKQQAPSFNHKAEEQKNAARSPEKFNSDVMSPPTSPHKRASR